MFSTSQWMVAIDDPRARATLRLRLTMPRAWTASASGREIARRETSASTVVVEWEHQKGAYALHELRELLGDVAFWAGIGRYTSEHVGHSVTTGYFRAAMEKASGRDLRAFFDRWVYQ